MAIPVLPGAGWAPEPHVASRVVMQEREMAHHNRNIGFFSMIAGSLLAAALLVALLVGGEIAGPKVAFNAPPPIVTR